MNRSLDFSGETVSAVVVTFNRDELLKRCLDHVTLQTHAITHTIVIDNANSESTKKLVESYGYIYISGAPSFGGAGGYKLGMEKAYSYNTDYVWLLDDDGYPEYNCLETQLKLSKLENLAISSPLCIDQEDFTQTSNPYVIGVKKVTSVTYLSNREVHTGVLQLFNGVLLSTNAISLIGFPIKDLFIRGDELDYYYRIKKLKIAYGLISPAHYFHPSSKSEYPNSRNSLFGVIIPADEKKKYYQFRNQGYLARKHRLALKASIDWLRYSVYFLVYPGRNWSGFKKWAQLWIAGFTLNLDHFPK